MNANARLILLWGATLLGCEASSPLACYPVRGTVVRDGKPVAGAVVVFHPVDPAANLKQKPIASTDDAGEFRVTTFKPGDGAPVGDYRITVVQRAPKLVGEEMVREGPNQLHGKLSDPSSSGSSFTVVEGENVMPTIAVPKR